MCDSRWITAFGTNDYLGLANAQAINTESPGAGASRLISGTHEAHAQLEEALSDWAHVERCLLFNSGYNANTGLFSALFGENDLILSDALNHASLIDGIRLSKASRQVYNHLDLLDLESKLAAAQSFECRVIVSETVFSMDGDQAPLADLVDLATRYDAVLVLDEAHAIGVFGPEGRGLAANAELHREIDVTVGTCGKALGSFGAYVAGSNELCQVLYNRARSLVFTTALPPAVAEQTTAHLAELKGGELARKLWLNIEQFRSECGRLGVPVQDCPGAIVPLILGAAEKTLATAQSLLDMGLWVPAIRPPTVPPGSSRLRLTLSAAHTGDDICRVVAALADHLG